MNRSKKMTRELFKRTEAKENFFCHCVDGLLLAEPKQNILT